MFWKTAKLNEIGENLLGSVDKCSCKIDGGWHTAEITKDGVINGKYQITAIIPENISGTITSIRFVEDDSIIGEKSKHIAKKEGKAMILKFRFNIYEGGEK